MTIGLSNYVSSREFIEVTEAGFCQTLMGTISPGTNHYEFLALSHWDEDSINNPDKA
jgi:hypothetical protein